MKEVTSFKQASALVPLAYAFLGEYDEEDWMAELKESDNLQMLGGSLFIAESKEDFEEIIENIFGEYDADVVLHTTDILILVGITNNAGGPVYAIPLEFADFRFMKLVTPK